MEFRLPFPSLKYLAAHRVVRCLAKMKIDKIYWVDLGAYRNAQWCECVDMVEKLPLPPKLKPYLRDQMNRLFTQVSTFTAHTSGKPGAEFIFDAYGNIDEQRMIRDNWVKCREGILYRKDFQSLSLLLKFATWYETGFNINILLQNIWALQRMEDVRLEGPEYDFPYIKYRVATQQKVSSAFDAIGSFFWRVGEPFDLSFYVEDDVVNIVWDMCSFCNVNAFKTYVDFLPPLDRINFIKSVMYTNNVHMIICFLNAMDTEIRLKYLTNLGKQRNTDEACSFLIGLLIPPYECFFIPALELVGFGLEKEDFCDIFCSVAYKLDLMGYNNLLLHYWQNIPTKEKRHFRWHLDYKERFQQAMTNVLEKDAILHATIVKDLRKIAPKRKLGRYLLRIALDWEDDDMNYDSYYDAYDDGLSGPSDDDFAGPRIDGNISDHSGDNEILDPDPRAHHYVEDIPLSDDSDNNGAVDMDDVF